METTLINSKKRVPDKGCTSNAESTAGFSRLKLLSAVYFLLMFCFISNQSYGQSNTNNSQWGKNGSAASPVSPVSWANGNAQGTNSHFKEGESIPTRIEMDGLTAGQTASVTFNFNIIRQNNSGVGKHAYDFMTGPNRIAEAVQPLDGLTGYDPARLLYQIPLPDDIDLKSNDTFLKMQCQQAHEDAEKKSLWLYNISSVISVTYVWGDEDSNATNDTYCTVTFIPTSSKALIAFGLHIAAEFDRNGCSGWGSGNGASAISGSPYHLHIANICSPLNNCVTLGSQDQQMASSAVIIPPMCSVSPSSAAVCAGATATFIASGIGGSGGSPYTFAWTGPGGYTATTASITVGAAGTYYVIVKDKNGVPTDDPCTASLTVGETSTANAGDDDRKCRAESGTTNFTIQNATSTGGTFAWSVNDNDATVTAVNITNGNTLAPTVQVTGYGTVTIRLTTTNADENCPNAMDDVVLRVYQPVFAGDDGAADYCASDDLTAVNLFNLLQGSGITTDGSWKLIKLNNNDVDEDKAEVVNLTSYGAAVLIFRYTVNPADENSECLPDYADVVITINPNPDVDDATVAYCDDDEGKVLLESFNDDIGGTGYDVVWYSDAVHTTGNEVTSFNKEDLALGNNYFYAIVTDNSKDTHCASFAKLTVTINPLPEVICAAPGDAEDPNNPDNKGFYSIECGVDLEAQQQGLDEAFGNWLDGFSPKVDNQDGFKVEVTYEYDPPSATPNPDDRPLVGPSYTVKVTWTVTDMNYDTQCVNSCFSTFIVNNPCAVGCETLVSNAACAGPDEKGTIYVSASGGTPPYNIYLYEAGSPDIGDPDNALDSALLINTEPAEVSFDVAAGDYVILATDAVTDIDQASRCEASVKQPKIITLVISKTDVTCKDSANGKLSIDSFDGTDDLEDPLDNPVFAISTDGTNFTPKTEAQIEGDDYGPGKYYIRICYPDGNNANSSLFKNETNIDPDGGDGVCCLVKDVTIGEPLLLEASCNGSAATCEGNDGSASVSVKGGTEPYTYLWDDDLSSTEDHISGLAPNRTYTVTVTDANGCTAPCSFEVKPAENCGGHIFPTQTECCNFTSGSATQLLNVCTKLQKGVIVGNAVPGVFFYYTNIVAPSSSFTIDVRQSNDGDLSKLFKVNQIQDVRMFTSSCVKLQAKGAITTSVSLLNGGSDAKYVVTGATQGATYIISVKYDVKSIVGAVYSGADMNSTYTFTSYINNVAYVPSIGHIDALFGCTDTTPLPPLCTSPTARTSDEISETNATSSINLVKAYPNPFKDHLTFELSADVSANASLQVFNILGQRVSDVFNGYLEAGTVRTVDFNTPYNMNESMLIYVYRLGDHTYTGRLIVKP